MLNYIMAVQAKAILVKTNFEIRAIIKMKHNENRKQGFLSAVGAYLLWGILPIYWKLIANVAAQEIIAHRIFWSLVFMLGLVAVTNNKKMVYDELRQLQLSPGKLLALVAGTVLITLNWFIFIWAVNDNRVIETSLGYYISPLVSILLGVIVYKERLSQGQGLAVLLAAGGMLFMIANFGSVPWFAISLAVSFGLYGLCKKIAVLSPITSITLETLIVAPFALLYLLYIGFEGTASVHGLSLSLALLVGSGIVTPVPLLLFANSAKYLPLTIIGFVQYLAPTISLLIGVFLYHEKFTFVHSVSFGLIWAALLVFSSSSIKLNRLDGQPKNYEVALKNER